MSKRVRLSLTLCVLAAALAVAAVMLARRDPDLASLATTVASTQTWADNDPAATRYSWLTNTMLAHLDEDAQMAVTDILTGKETFLRVNEAVYHNQSFSTSPDGRNIVWNLTGAGATPTRIRPCKPPGMPSIRYIDIADRGVNQNFVWLPDSSGWAREHYEDPSLPITGPPHPRGWYLSVVRAAKPDSEQIVPLPQVSKVTSTPETVREGELLGIKPDGALVLGDLTQAKLDGEISSPSYPSFVVREVTLQSTGVSTRRFRVRVPIVPVHPSYGWHILLSPKGDRLLYVQEEALSTMSDYTSWLTGLFRNNSCRCAQPPSNMKFNSLAIWVGGLDQRPPRLIGRLRTDGTERVHFDVQWMPDGQGVSYYCNQGIHTVPVK